jgi:transposase
LREKYIKIFAELLKNNKYYTSTDIYKFLCEKDLKISKNTIINILNEMNFNFKSPVSKPLLTTKHTEKRLEWCKKYLEFKDWKYVKFTDESSFWMGHNGKRWVNMNENDIDTSVKHPFKVHVWGSISIHYKRELYIFTEILTAQIYLEILQNNLRISKNLIFQDDNDPKHTAKIVKEWKVQKLTCLDWPSNSPDLNPIENIWGVLKTNVNKHNFKTREEFILIIKKCWNEIDQNTINNTINSMPKRIKQVIENNGFSINY